MKLPANYRKRTQPPELTADGYDMNHMASLRASVQNKHQPMPRRAACMDCLPEHYRVGLPEDVDACRKQYKDILGNV